VLQSLPFVLVGVFASAIVQQALRDEIVARWLPRRHLPAVLVSSLFGLVAPVCDCGAIPLGRRLMAKGLPAFAGVSFVLAAPVVNPISIFSTAVAFQGNVGVVALRVGMTLSVAVLIGLLAGQLVRRGADPPVETKSAVDFRIVAVADQATVEYFEIIFFIVLGALFTAASQTLVPRTDLAALGAQRAGSVLILMPVATVLSICSEADAFVARAFAGSFSLGAVMAFMTIGQIVDLRNGLLLWRTLGGRLMLLVVLIAYPLVFAEGVLLNRVVGG
jgi:uncharacterized membrane protein YraQ (UPF0718 family)